LMNVSWVTEESYEVIPYFKLGIAGKRWYLKKQFYIIS